MLCMKLFLFCLFGHLAPAALAADHADHFFFFASLPNYPLGSQSLYPMHAGKKPTCIFAAFSHH